MKISPVISSRVIASILFLYVWIRCPFYLETNSALLKKKMAGWIKAEEKIGYLFVGAPPIDGEFLFKKAS